MRCTNLLVYLLLYLASAALSCRPGDDPGLKPDCEDDDPYADLQNVMGQINTNQPIFPGTDKIDFSGYSYTLSGNSYTINMRSTPSNNDLCDFLENITVHANTPRFIVPAINSKLIAFAISTKLLEIRLDKTSIQNVDDIIWTWNSGLNTGKISSGSLIVDYKEGKKVIHGKISDTALNPLQPGRLYFFTMWSWDDNGTRIVSSSPTIPFMVGSNWYNFATMAHLSRGGPSLYSAVRWKLVDAVDLTTGMPVAPSMRPAYFDIHFYICSEPRARASTEVFYEEEGKERTISFYGNTVRVLDSDYFKGPLNILFSCESRLVLRTDVGGRTVVLRYER